MGVVFEFFSALHYAHHGVGGWGVGRQAKRVVVNEEWER